MAQPWMFIIIIIIIIIIIMISKKGGTSMRSFACPCAHHKDIRGSGSTIPFILNLNTTWTWVVSFTAGPLYLRQTDPVPTEQKAQTNELKQLSTVQART